MALSVPVSQPMVGSISTMSRKLSSSTRGGKRCGSAKAPAVIVTPRAATPSVAMRRAWRGVSAKMPNTWPITTVMRIAPRNGPAMT